MVLFAIVESVLDDLVSIEAYEGLRKRAMSREWGALKDAVKESISWED